MLPDLSRGRTSCAKEGNPSGGPGLSNLPISCRLFNAEIRKGDPARAGMRESETKGRSNSEAQGGLAEVLSHRRVPRPALLPCSLPATHKR